MRWTIRRGACYGALKAAKHLGPRHLDSTGLALNEVAHPDYADSLRAVTSRTAEDCLIDHSEASRRFLLQLK